MISIAAIIAQQQEEIDREAALQLAHDKAEARAFLASFPVAEQYRLAEFLGWAVNQPDTPPDKPYVFERADISIHK